MNECILVIPDLHFPHAHPDVFSFLREVKKTFKPDRTIMLGDELDYHALSFHDSDPDLDSAGKELEKSIGYIETLVKLFPVVDILESNHGSMAYRKQKHHGMPRHLLKGYSEVLGTPPTWKWHVELVVRLPNGESCLFVHSASANVLAASQLGGVSLVQGHHHSLFEIRYWQSLGRLHFAATAGCIIDDHSLSMSYNKLHRKQPILGCLIIRNSIPILIPMRLDKRNRWVGAI